MNRTQNESISKKCYHLGIKQEYSKIIIMSILFFFMFQKIPIKTDWQRSSQRQDDLIVNLSMKCLFVQRPKIMSLKYRSKQNLLIHKVSGLCMHLDSKNQLVMTACDKAEPRSKWTWKKNEKKISQFLERREEENPPKFNLDSYRNQRLFCTLNQSINQSSKIDT